MLVKCFSAGKASLDYVRGKEHGPIFGDVETFKLLVRNCPFKDPVLSGAISFQENVFDEEVRDQIIRSFERSVLFPGLSPDRFCRIWTAHKEPTGVAWHFHVLKEDLKTGKQYNPYFHKADVVRKDAWQELINHHFGFSNPNDPNRLSTLAPDKHVPNSVVEYKELISQLVNLQIQNGKITSFEDVLREIESNGFQVVKIGQLKSGGYVSISTSAHVRNIRLKGALFDSTKFDAYREKLLSNERFRKKFQRSPQEIAEFRRTFFREYKKAAKRNKSRYGIPEQNIVNSDSKDSRNSTHHQYFTKRFSEIRKNPRRLFDMLSTFSDQPIGMVLLKVLKKVFSPERKPDLNLDKIRSIKKERIKVREISPSL